MAKITVRNRFWVIPNQLLNNKDVSWKAKGLYWYLQSKPDNWDFAVNRICIDWKDWEKWVRSWIQELEKIWYLQRNKFKDAKWKWDIEYILYDTPIAENRQWTQPQPIAENRHAENRHAENRQTNKERNSKKEISKKENIYREKSFFENNELNNMFIDFLDNRKDLKKPATKRAIEMLIKKINKWLENYSVEDVISCIEMSITKSWTDIYIKDSTLWKNYQNYKQDSHLTKNFQEEKDFVPF